ncbi:syntaxin-2-like [Patella vulgata]|uniref:syntaxin-2-like n=1 Tax=Patella vulgata TaxID=6465 RepID=UPI0024A8FC70|nr:syntaxin-2-like [Patella vulgata]
MVKDRLEDLKQRSKEYSKVPLKEKKPPKVMADGRGIQNFLHDVEKVETELNLLKEKVENMKKIQLTILSSPFGQDNKKQYEKLVDVIRKDSSKIRKSLKNIEGQVEENPKEENSALNRIRSEQLNRLTLGLAQTSNDFFTAQSDYMEKIKVLVRKQCDIANKGDSELQEILDAEGDFKVFTQDYITDVQDAEEQLRMIEERDKDIQALEKNICQVNELFIDMSVLVSEQGETIVNIEKQVLEASSNVVGGKDQLRQAEISRKKSRKRCCCFIGIGIVAALLVAAIIAGIILS